MQVAGWVLAGRADRVVGRRGQAQDGGGARPGEEIADLPQFWGGDKSLTRVESSLTRVELAHGGHVDERVGLGVKHDAARTVR